MNYSTPEAVGQPAQDYAVTHPLRPLARAALVTLIAFASGVLAVALLVRENSAFSFYALWLAISVAFLLVWAGLVVTMALRKPGAAEQVRVWGFASRFITYASQAIVVAAIWGFFPASSDVQRVALTGMFMLNSPAQIVAAPENVLPIRIGIVAIYGSLVLWHALNPSAYATPLSLFAAAVGVGFLFLAGIAPAIVHEVARARVEAEESNAQLQAALAEVAAERDAKTQFIAAASHDLGQPLQAANLFFSQMERAQSPEHRGQAAEGVRKAFASAEQLLSHMLNHLRLEADAVEAHLAAIPTSAALARIAALHQATAREAGVALRALTSRHSLIADRVLLDRALGNLVDNAIRHSGASRILLLARKQANNCVRLWVLDDGVGIGSMDAARIFEDYYRGSDSRAATKSGFGLGLSSVLRLAKLMEGEAGLDQRWQRGAAFYLDFPIAERGKFRAMRRPQRKEA